MLGLAYCCISLLFFAQENEAFKFATVLRISKQSPLSSTLSSWINKEVGENSLKVDIKTDSDGSVYTVAKDGIKKGDTLFSLPQGLCLDASTASNKFGFVSASDLRTGDIGMIALLLISEKYAGKGSKYDSYIASFPQSAPGTLSWNDELNSLLLLSSSRNFKSQLNAIEADTNYLDRSGVLSRVAKGASRDDFRLALGIVKSRCVFLNGKPCLVPGPVQVTQFLPT